METNLKKLSARGLLVTFGIVFGDIGTSPLYVMKAICAATPDYGPDYIIGAVSLVIWTLTLQTTIKYVLIALRADNKGEGGILALYSLVRKGGKKWLYVLAAIGASTLVADGVITPAITVTTSVEGLQAIMPDPPVIPLAMVVITLIFIAQSQGTSSIGRMFGPAMLAWFVMLGVLGAANLGHAPEIFKAFNPWYAVKVLVDYPGWWLILGAVFLCTTGAEALYSDLGHCGRRNISVAWLFVKLMLILNYLGQGSWIIAHRGDIGPEVNPFYAIMPHWWLLPGIIMSTIASIIASQALISGSFTIFSEAMNIDFWPRLRIKYPSSVKGQLYIPSVNIFLYAGCILTVAIFQTSAHMEGAYGLAITITMLVTTVLLAIWLRQHGTGRLAVAAFLVLFVIIEGVFLCANLFKFMHGGWYTLLIAGGMAAIVISWKQASRIRSRYFTFSRISDKIDTIAGISADREIAKYASNLVYISHSQSESEIESKIIYSIINKQPKRADHYFFLRVEYTDEPYTLEYSATELLAGKIFSIGMRIGFRVEPRVTL
ncbi:MAG: KUP/HAK/KT family potassium transporter, partial [Muribaculaceae bacterium]|nr:KUP/HAK/KT family potassium transporter [Muribaculaceae bacterium]